MSGTTLPVLIPIPSLPAATTPLGASDLLLVEQDGLAKKVTAATVLPGGTISPNLIYAGPASGSAAVPEFRLLVAADIPGTLDSTAIDGTLDATALTVGGNSVLRFAQQGSITVYGGLVIGANLTLDAGGTLSAAGGGAGSGTVDLGTANHIAYYAASTAQVGSATYVAIGSGAAAGILVLGLASTRSGGVIMSDALSNATGTLTVAANVVGLVGGAGAGTVDGAGVALTAGNAAATGNGGDITLAVGTTAAGARDGQLLIQNLPTADSLVSSSVWWDNGVLVQTGHTATATGTILVTGVLSGGTITGSGTVGLAVGAGISSGSGTIANSGVLSIDAATGAILIGAGLQRSSQTISVKAATTAALGGIIVGTGLTVDGSGTLTAGAVSSLVAGAGLTTSIASSNGTITGSGTLTALELPIAQTGTAYAFAAGDRATLVTFSNTAAIAATIGQAGSIFPAGWWCDFQNIGTGLLTITPTTSTISGRTTYQAMTGFGGRIISDGTNYLVQNSAALYALASSAISNWQPGIPSSTLGGNARGANALDIQAVRNNATQVASGSTAVAYGNYSTSSATSSVAFGVLAKATAASAIAIGGGSGVDATGTSSIAMGNSSSATAQDSVVIGGGSTNTGARAIVHGTAISNLGGTNSIIQGVSISATGGNSIVNGTLGDDRGNFGGRIWAPRSLNSTTNRGHTQVEDYLFMINTTGSSAVRLTTDAASAGSANTGNLGTNQAALVTVDIVITDFTTGKSATFYLAQSLLEKGANNAATTFTPNGGGVVAGPASSGVFTLAADPTVTADTTNGGLNISYTPPAANTDTFYAEARVRYVTLRNN